MSSLSDYQWIIAEIIAAPRDNLPRLAYADWLEEYGKGPSDQDRAKFIRLQIQSLKAKTWNEQEPLLRQANEILAKHREEWEQPLTAAGATVTNWHRGFPAGMTITVGDFVANGGQIFSVVPVSSVVISDISDDNIEAFAASPYLQYVSELHLELNQVGDQGAIALAASPNLNSLTFLNLWANRIGNAGAFALAASPVLTNLVTLNLSGNHIGPEGAEALLRSPNLTKLSRLALDNNEGIQAHTLGRIAEAMDKRRKAAQGEGHGTPG